MNEKPMIEDLLETLKPEIKVELHKTMVEFDQLKNTLHDGYMRFSTLQALDAVNKNKDVLEAIDAPTEEQISESQKSVTEEKKEVNRYKSCILDTAKELEKVYEDYKASLKVLEELTKDDQETLSTTELSDNSANEIESLQKQRSELNSLIRDTENKLSAAELNLLTMASFKDLEQEKRIKNDMNRCIIEKNIAERCSEMLAFIEWLPGIRDRGITGNKWCVSIGGMESEQSKLELNVTMTLDLCLDKLILRSAQVDNTDIDFTDIIHRAVSLNDIRYLLAKLQQVWLFQYTFVNELESLRRCYALDWDQSTHTLKVIYGKRADQVCVLNIRPDYPANGAVTLESVKGETDLESFKLFKQDSTLTEWLRHLHEKLNDR